MGLNTKLYSESFYRKMRDSENHLLEQLASSQCDISVLHNRAYHLRNNGMISFLPEGKDAVYDDEGMWTDKNRQEIKPGKAIRHLCNWLSISCSDADLEYAVHTLIAVADENKASPIKEEFRLVKGKEIHAWYSKQVCSVSGNCMIGKPESIFELYISNPDIVQLLILTTPAGLLLGRALVWNTNQGRIMDRVYGSGVVHRKFILYAKEQSWAYKEEQTFGERNFHYPPQYKSENRHIKIAMDTKIGLYPYLDSLMKVYTWGISSKSPIMHTAKKDDDMPLAKTHFMGTATSTKGDLAERQAECCQCGSFMSVGNMVRLNGNYYCAEHTIACAITGNRILADAAVQLANGTYADRTSQYLVQIDGAYYNGNDPRQVVKYKEVWYLTKDCVRNTAVEEYNVGAYIPKEYAIEIPQFNIWLSKDTYINDMKQYGFVQVDGTWFNEEQLRAAEEEKKRREAIAEAAKKEKELAKATKTVKAKNAEPEDNDPFAGAFIEPKIPIVKKRRVTRRV